MNETKKTDDSAPLHDVLDVAPLPQVPARAEQPKPLPAIVEHRPAGKKAVWTRRLAILLLIGGGAGFLWIQAHRAPAIPAWIVYGNGRLEADPIDIDTKFAGRIAELRVDEGDAVKAGQVLALMDVRDLAQTLKRDEAQIEQAQKAVDEAIANVATARSQSVLAEQEMVRAEKLTREGWMTHETYDQRKQSLDAARATQTAAEHRVSEGENALKAARHDAEVVRVNINDNTLVAPRDGRIEYRVANVGEVLPAGGKVFTMLDTGYVYMDVYLPTLSADKVKIGADARILLDAYPDRPIPAQSLVPGRPGAIHAEDGGDPERPRQADVPGAGAHRPGALARPWRRRAQRPARGGLCEDRRSRGLDPGLAGTGGMSGPDAAERQGGGSAAPFAP